MFHINKRKRNEEYDLSLRRIYHNIPQTSNVQAQSSDEPLDLTCTNRNKVTSESQDMDGLKVNNEEGISTAELINEHGLMNYTRRHKKTLKMSDKILSAESENISDSINYTGRNQRTMTVSDKKSVWTSESRDEHNLMNYKEINQNTLKLNEEEGIWAAELQKVQGLMNDIERKQKTVTVSDEKGNTFDLNFFGHSRWDYRGEQLSNLLEVTPDISEGTSDNGTNGTDTQWTQPRTSQSEGNSNNIPYTQNVPRTNQPIDYFRSIVTDKMINLIVSETNAYAERLMTATTPAPKARIKLWNSLSADEFLTWLGLVFHTGMIVMNRVCDYWSTDVLNNLKIFRSSMKRDRFLNILESLHFSSNSSEHSTCFRSDKIQPLIDIYHTTIDSIVASTKQLCINEAMALWRGRFVFRLFLKNEKTRYTFRLYTLNEPTGLALRLLVYNEGLDMELSGPGQSANIVLNLMEGRLDRGHSLHVDKCLNSVFLAQQLLARKTYVTGLVSVNCKGNPHEVIRKDVNPGELFQAFTSEGIRFLKWKANKDFIMISSELKTDMTDLIHLNGPTVSKPGIIFKLKKPISGLEYVEQIMTNYPMERKPLKWYKKLGIHVLHLCLLSSYYIYKMANPSSHMTLHNYRLSVIKSLLLPLHKSSTTNKRSMSTSILSQTPNKLLHVSKQYSTNEGEIQYYTKKCKLCAKRQIDKDTSYFCPSCPEKPALCVPKCFQEYNHTAKKSFISSMPAPGFKK